ncbi:nuclear transport factor 2 family protein [Deinococcus detaillensis]|nr:nuclear transport factor 2 family protein [Deinococcus detaillensis]
MTQSSNSLTQQFMKALHTAEDSGDLSALLALHAETVTLHNLTQQDWSGLDGAKIFWERYLSDFETIHSDFTHHADAEDMGVMEWVGKGALKGGQAIEYRGISVIEHDGQKVTAFRTYYDSAAFIKTAAG